MIKVTTVIQARMSSSRLPGKVLLPLAGKPLLVRMIERVKASEHCGRVVVATTYLNDDDPIVDLCKKNSISFYRGHPDDLLDRHLNVGKKYNSNAVVKIPSDCPLIDPAVIDKVIKHYLDNYTSLDYVSNLHPPTYPDGNDVEIFSLECLEKAWEEAGKELEREHTTPYFWENPDKFKIGNVTWEAGLDYSMSHRFTIDYEEDYNFIASIYNELYDENKTFSLYDILSLLDEKPELSKINEKYLGVNWYRHHLNELKTISEKNTKILLDEKSKTRIREYRT
ncbi:MAG: glycosyltransferase family protein [Ignavibacteriaceae bacterium]